MMAIAVSDSNDERRRRVFVGDLPEDFLRLTPPSEQSAPVACSEEQQRALQIARDEQAALALQRNMDLTNRQVGRLTLTIAEARLVKNYGMTRMDPYVRLRIGHNIYETQTHFNGAKNPRWDKVFHCFIPNGVMTFLVEIFDECAFTASEKIAWAHVPISESVLKGETVEEWIPLNGKQGDGKEGAINIVMSYVLLPAQSLLSPQIMHVGAVPAQMPFGFGPTVRPVATQVVPGLAAVPNVDGSLPVGQIGGQTVLQSREAAPVPITEEDVKQLKEMFPSIEDDVVKNILEIHGGNKDAAISDLLQLSNV